MLAFTSEMVPWETRATFATSSRVSIGVITSANIGGSVAGLPGAVLPCSLCLSFALSAMISSNLSASTVRLVEDYPLHRVLPCWQAYLFSWKQGDAVLAANVMPVVAIK